MHFYDVTEGGNWEGHNILRVKETPEAVAQSLNLEIGEMAARLETARQILLAARAQRTWPGLDNKVLTAWNGLMLAAFAEAGRVLHRADYTKIAVQNATFLYETMRNENGRLHRTWKGGHDAKFNGYLEDYAYLADGLLALYQTTFDGRWFTWAHELADLMLTHFRDEADGGFFDTADDHEALLHRPKDVQDNATPSANAMAARVLLQLSLYTGNGEYWDIAAQSTTSLHEAMAQYPTGFAHWLGNAAFILSQPREVAIVGDPAAADTAVLRDTVFAHYRPDLVVALGNEGDGEMVPLLEGRPLHDGKATAYVCRRFVCQQPVTEPEALAVQLRQ